MYKDPSESLQCVWVALVASESTELNRGRIEAHSNNTSSAGQSDLPVQAPTRILEADSFKVMSLLSVTLLHTTVR